VTYSADPPNLLSERGMRVLLAVRELAISQVETGNLDPPTLPEWIESYLSEALSLGMADVIAATRAKHYSHNWVIRLNSELRLYVPTETKHESTQLEDVAELAAKAKKDGVTSLSTFQVLTLVLVWLVALSTPVAQQTLPPEVQAVLNSEVATVGLAIALTAVIISRKS
jgi:hypothetical protein